MPQYALYKNLWPQSPTHAPVWQISNKIRLFVRKMHNVMLLRRWEMVPRKKTKTPLEAAGIPSVKKEDRFASKNE